MSKLVLHSWDFFGGRPYCPPPDTGLDLVYEDAYLLAVNKPPGLLSVPGKGSGKEDCQESRVERELGPALVVHRLDMETSGLLLFARDKSTQRDLNARFARRQIHKQYHARVTGVPVFNYGIVDLPLIADWDHRPRQKVDFVFGKPSCTGYQLESVCPESNTSVLRLYPYTGRSHQLRLHMHAIGHSIVGDRIYAIEKPVGNPGRLQLHASRLEFLHPVTGKLLTLDCNPSF